MLLQVDNTGKYFLGSLHLLPENNLDDRIWRVHEKVSRVVFECDFSQSKDPNLGVYGDGYRLNHVVPPDLYSRCAKRWESLKIKSRLSSCKPWWAGLMIAINTMRANGFTVGMDSQMFEKTHPSQRAFLEPPNTYLLTLNEMPLVEQIAQLQQGCDEEKVMSHANRLYSAWKASDLRGLRDFLNISAAETPLTMYATLGGRNRTWTPKILELLSDSTPTLFVLGALHYIGTDSIPDCLNEGPKYLFKQLF